jgi:hypothetical protein
MTIKHNSFGDLKSHLYDHIPKGSAGDRLDMQVSGNPAVLEEAELGNNNLSAPSYRKSGGRVAHTHKAYFSDAHNYRRGSR